MRIEKTKSGEMIQVWEERSFQSVHIVLKVELENGTVLLYDDLAGQALGSDGVIYAPVYRDAEGAEDDVDIIGWYAGDREVMV